MDVAFYLFALFPRLPGFFRPPQRGRVREGGQWLGAKRIPPCRGTPLGDLPLKGGGVVVSDASWVTNHQSSFPPSRSRLTSGVCKSLAIRSASSNLSSTRKRMSGANFSLTRREISPRTSR